jgi:thiamine-monophosphate kinase
METLSTLGEFGLIHRIQGLIREEGVSAPGLTLGLGDDCAAFLPRGGHHLLITCDCMVEGRHYLPQWISPFDLGRRAMTMNISDIGAMGGSPLYAVVSLGLKGEENVDGILEMYRGFLSELNPLNASIIGGNITKTDGSPFIDITLVGEVAVGSMLRRSSAKVGDVILVTGFPGRSGAGLQLLRKAASWEEVRGEPLIRAYNTPTHRAREGRAVALSGHATAMIDTSDGFLGDLGHICEESRVGVELNKDRLPLSEDLIRAASRLGKDPYEFFFGESDDYELIFTCPPQHVGNLRSAVASVSDVAVTEVGRITAADRGMRLVEPDGTASTIRPAGWDHFSAS